jgi:hypothetical protein
MILENDVLLTKRAFTALERDRLGKDGVCRFFDCEKLPRGPGEH